MSTVNDIANLYKIISEEVTPSEKRVMKPDHRNPKGKAEKPRGGDPRSKEEIDEASFDIGPGHKGAMRGSKIYNKGKSTTNPNEKDAFLKKSGAQLPPLVKKKPSMQMSGYEPEGENLDEVIGGRPGDGYIGHPNLNIKNPLAKKQVKSPTGNKGLAGRLGDRNMRLKQMMNQSFESEGDDIQEREESNIGGGNLKKLSVKASKRIDTNVSGFVDKNDKSMGNYGEFVPSVDGKKKIVTKIGEGAEEQKFCPFCNKTETKSECSYGPEVWEKSGIPMFSAKIYEAKERGMSHDDTYDMMSNHQYSKKQLWDMQKKATQRGDHGVASGIYSRWKEMKNEDFVSERALDDAEKNEKERIVKGLKKRASDFKKKYGDDYKSVMYATATKTAKKNMDTSKSDARYAVEEVDYIEEKARGTRKKSTVHAYDVDETLFSHGKKGKPNVKVHVNDSSGKRVKSLSNQEFNTHKLDKGHKYDFGEFSSAKKFKETSSPNKKVVKDIKRKISRGKNVHLVTARSKFDKPDEFHGHLKKHGINVDKKNIHYTGGMSKGSNKNLDVGKKKVKVADAIAKKADAKKVHMYDDAAKVHKGFEAAKKDKPTSMKYKTQMAAPDKKTGETKIRSYQATKKEETAYDYWKQFLPESPELDREISGQQSKYGGKFVKSTARPRSHPALPTAGRGGQASFKAGGGNAAMAKRPGISAAMVQKQGMQNLRRKRVMDASVKQTPPAANVSVSKPKTIASKSGAGGKVTVGKKYAATLGGKKGNVTYDASGKKSFTASL